MRERVIRVWGCMDGTARHLTLALGLEASCRSSCLLLLPSLHPGPPAASRAEPVRDIRCEFCGEFFENRKGLSSHARSHLRQMGVTEWSVNGSPIDTLREILKKKSKPCLIKKEPPAGDLAPALAEDGPPTAAPGPVPSKARDEWPGTEGRPGDLNLSSGSEVSGTKEAGGQRLMGARNKRTKNERAHVNL